MVSASLAAGLALSPAPSAQAQPAPTPAVIVGDVAPFVAVSAVGEERVVPDRARISIGVQTKAATASAASAQNARLQTAIMDTLRALGIPRERITTSGYNVYPEQTFIQETRTSRITGYNVQNTVVVDLQQVDQVGRVLDAVLAKGANLVSSLEFYSSQGEAARRRALAAAVTKARQDAEAMAAAAGGRLGALVELSSVVYAERPRPLIGMAMRAEAAQADTPVSEGTQTVSASVSARWRFIGPGQ